MTTPLPSAGVPGGAGHQKTKSEGATPSMLSNQLGKNYAPTGKKLMPIYYYSLFQESKRCSFSKWWIVVHSNSNSSQWIFRMFSLKEEEAKTIAPLSTLNNNKIQEWQVGWTRARSSTTRSSLKKRSVRIFWTFGSFNRNIVVFQNQKAKSHMGYYSVGPTP